MVTLPTVSELLKKYSITADKKLGQNFLLDSNITDKITRYIPNLDQVEIIEIGSGPGALTRSLLEGPALKIYAVEFDKRMLPLLSELHDAHPHRLQIINQDAMQLDELALKTVNPIAIAGNLPYNISVQLLFKWLENIQHFSSLTLMFQKEVAERICAKPKNKSYGIVSVMTQFSCDVYHNFDINPASFTPPPSIWSSVITIIPKKSGSYPKYLRHTLSCLCKAAFGQRRKTLRNSLGSYYGSAQTEDMLALCNINATCRAEELSVEQFIHLAEFIHRKQLAES